MLAAIRKGNNMRSCIVEIDKTVDTAWPPATVQPNGQSHSLAGVYQASGLQLNS